jgi:hypothetical protein
VSAMIGAIYTVTSLPSKIHNGYKYIFTDSIQRKIEYKKIDKIDVRSTFDYVVTIFGEPSSEQKCSNSINETQSIFIPCIFPDVANKKYTWEFEEYFLQILTDENMELFSYSILSRTKNFKYNRELFLGRFMGDKNLILNKTKFSEFSEYNDYSTHQLNTSFVGSNFGGHLKFLYSNDYSVEYSILLETSYPPSWFKAFRGYNDSCEFSLLTKYPEIEQDEYEQNIQNFEKKCQIEAVTIIDNSKIWEQFLTQEGEILEAQLTLLDIP